MKYNFQGTWTMMGGEMDIKCLRDLSIKWCMRVTWIKKKPAQVRD